MIVASLRPSIARPLDNRYTPLLAGICFTETGELCASAWDLLRRNLPRVGRGRRAALLLGVALRTETARVHMDSTIRLTVPGTSGIVLMTKRA